MPKRICPHCGQPFEISDAKVGEHFPCPRCGQDILMPRKAREPAEKIKLTVTPPPPDIYQAPQLAGIARQIITNVERVIVGKPEQVMLAVVGLFAEGHILFEDVPGVAKTMLSRAVAQSVGCSFKRIQCTPGFAAGTRRRRFRAGSDNGPERFPVRAVVFANGAGGRNQPRQSAHAVGAARGHG